MVQDRRPARAQSLGHDFQRLWAAYSLSALGSAVSAGALPLIAVTLLHASTLQVSLLAAVSGIASAAVALPLGPLVEYRRKRPVMVGADLIRCMATASVPLAALTGSLTFAQLCLVGVINTAATIGFTGASSAHLKSLLPIRHLTAANSRFESTFWITNSLGSPVGGALISLVGATVTLAVDSVSYLVSALVVHRIRKPEPTPAVRLSISPVSSDLVTGWRYTFSDRHLSALFWNAMLFGGSIMMGSALMAVFMLRDLGLAPWQYGLVLGLPCLGGVLGSAATPRLTRRFGSRRVLLVFGAMRAPWLLLLPMAPAGSGGLVLLLAADFGLLFTAGVFNPSFATYRMRLVDDGFMARVSIAWSISSRTAQPFFIAAGGVLASATSLRTALLTGGVLCSASALLLPWSQPAQDQPKACKPRGFRPSSHW